MTYRIPQTGECWRHYKGGLYTVVGMAVHSDGNAYVVYTGFGSTVIPARLFIRAIGEWLQEIETGKEPDMHKPGKSIMAPRFDYERPAGSDPKCPFIRSPSLSHNDWGRYVGRTITRLDGSKTAVVSASFNGADGFLFTASDGRPITHADIAAQP